VGTAVVLTGPATDFAVKMNPITGYPNDVMFTWLKPSDNALSYDLWVALDSKFDQTIRGAGSAVITSPTPVVSFNMAGSSFTPGTTYYWKVRVAGTGPIYSSWSEVQSFTVGEAEGLPPVVVTQTPAPQITITPPDVIVNVPPMVEVPTSTVTPIWIYVVIVIGALLLIAVIILIVRTRRAA